MGCASHPIRPLTRDFASMVLGSAPQVCDPHSVNGKSRIVVGVDHSEESLMALEFAVEEAELRNADLEVVWAWGDHMPVSEMSGYAIDAVEVEARAQMQLDGLVTSRIPKDLDVTTRAIVDKPEAALLDSARSAGLLVVGARGHGGFLGLQLGSVSLKVASHAVCPVAVIRPQVEAPESRSEPRIVVGIDGSDSARNALRWAMAEAAIRGLPVTVVNGWMEPAVDIPYPGLVAPVEAIERAAKELLDSEIEAAAQRNPDVSVRAEPVCAGGASALIDASNGASLVVVGSKGQGDFIGHLLGSVTQQVLRHAGCSTVVIPSR